MKKLFTLLTLLVCLCTGAWADPTYKDDFTDGQIIWTTKANVDGAVTAGWMALGGKMSGTKNLKNKLLVDPNTDALCTSAPYTSDTPFYIEKLYNSTNSNDQSLYIYVTGVARIFFYAWCNSTPDGRTLDITVNGEAKGSISYAAGTANAQYTSVILTKAANNIIRINGSNEVELTAIKVETTEKSASSLVFESTSGTGDIKDGTSYTLPVLTKTPNDATVTYTSSNTSAATVNSSTGAVTLVAPGVTTITASFEGNASYYPSSATYTLTVVNTAANNITVTYDISGVAGIEGTAPASFNIDEGLTFDLPATNQILYVEGKTLTGWSDGTNNYALGATVTAAATDMTLTPIFTDNDASAYLGHNASTAAWNFKTSTGAPTWALQGAGATGIYVTQTTIGGNTIDVKLDIDATSGKFNNATNENYVQINTGTILTVPVIIGAIVKVYVYSDAAAPKFNGEDGTYDSTNKIYSYTATAAGNVNIVYGGDDWASKVEVVYPSETALLTVSANNTIVPFTKANINDKDYLAVSTNNWATGKTYGGYTGDFYNMSSADRKLTIKVTGASAFEAFVRNDNGSETRSFKVKVGDADAVDISAEPSTLKSTGVFAIADPSSEITITLSGGGSSVYPAYIVFNPAASVSTLSGRNYATYITSQKLDFSAADGITAYVATGLNGASDAVVLQEVDVVPAGTPILVKTDTKGTTINVPVTTTDADVVFSGSDNKLVAGDGTTSYSAGTYYFLKEDKFHLATSGTLQAGKAYLQMSGSLAPVLNICFGDVTGINAIKGSELMINSKVYNLNGQRVADPTKGLYIVNGKKVVIK